MAKPESSQSAEPVAAVLGDEPPASVSALPEKTRARLADQIAQAKAAQAARVEASVVVALKGVPLPVRGVVRKALTG